MLGTTWTAFNTDKTIYQTPATVSTETATISGLTKGTTYATGTLHVKQTDLAGNVTDSTNATDLIVPIDISVPEAPDTPLVVSDANKDGVLNAYETSNSTSIKVTSALHNANGSETAELFVNGSTTAIVGTVDAAKQLATFSVPVSSLVNNVTNSFELRLSNTIGSTDGISSTMLNVDMTAPKAASISVDSNGNVIAAGLELGTTWTAFNTDKTIYQTPATVSTETATISGLTKGTTYATGTLHVKQTDLAGNFTDSTNATDLIVPIDISHTISKVADGLEFNGTTGVKDIFNINYAADANGAFGDFGSVVINDFDKAQDVLIFHNTEPKVSVSDKGVGFVPISIIKNNGNALIDFNEDPSLGADASITLTGIAKIPAGTNALNIDVDNIIFN